MEKQQQQLDLNAPLLSVRRIASKIQPRSKAVENPRFIPFTWEQTPGTRKGGILLENGEGESKIVEKNEVKERDNGDEMHSSNESFFDCSVSDYSDGSDDVETSESLSMELEAREFMMGRFLTAAKAMASPSREPQRVKEKARKDVNCRRVPGRLPYQHTAVTVSKVAYDQEAESYSYDDDEEEGYKGADNFSRGCGLISKICLKSSFLLLNPVPGMKVRDHLVSDHGSFTEAEDESWDDPLEDESKLTSESNQLTCWSDSQTNDDSSHHHSPRSPFREEKGFLGVPKRESKSRKSASFDWCEKVGEKYSNAKPQKNSMSPSIDRTLCVVDKLNTPSPKSSSMDAYEDNAYKDPEAIVHGEKHQLRPKINEFVESGLSSSPDRSSFEGMSCGNDGLGDVKAEEEEKNGDSMALTLALLPPPLPQSPSESWLKRTLPMVSSNHQSKQSLLGIQVQHRKQASRASSKDFSWENGAALKRQPRQTRFAHVLTEP